MIRIGVSPEQFLTRDAREKFFADLGRGMYECIREAVPYQDGQVVLDFGCGAGRVLRWFAAEPEVRLTGCDIHKATIAWMRDHFPSSIRLYANEAAPPLPEADDTFDLVYCGSVFSHLTDWAPWAAELWRVLKPGGAVVASLHGRGLWNLGFHGDRGISWDEENTGMLVEHYGDTFDDSWGPAVYVSEWWVREHWGRLFDIERFEPTGFGMSDNANSGQAWIVVRKPRSRPSPTGVDLEAPAADAREMHAALRGRQLAYEEVEHLANYLRGQRQSADHEIAVLARQLSVVEDSRSWHLTKPLRALAQRVRVVKHAASGSRRPRAGERR